jgi:hypothetical protein
MADAVIGLVVPHAYSAREKRLEFSDVDLSFYGRSWVRAEALFFLLPASNMLLPPTASAMTAA